MRSKICVEKASKFNALVTVSGNFLYKTDNAELSCFNKVGNHTMLNL